jgi:protein-tyrosine phosphatase
VARRAEELYGERESAEFDGVYTAFDRAHRLAGKAAAEAAPAVDPSLLEEGAERELHDALANGGVRRLGEAGRYALVEVPFMAPAPGLGAVLRRMIAAGVRPIVAHPERCVEFERPGRAEEVAALGATYQLNIGALTGRHGPRARELARRLLDAGLYSVVGTDLHAPDGARAWVAAAIEALEDHAGREAVERLCAENPRRVLAGEELA